ncbi:unnamed protein product, partial [Vitis vinifera]
MEKTRDDNGEEEEEENKPKNVRELRRRELGLSCMLNTEVGAVLAVIRRPSDTNSQFLAAQEDNFDSSLLHSLKSLRALIFNPQQEWRTIDPSIYLAPFLDVVQSDDVPATATGVALSAIFMILKLEIFDEKTPGARDAVNSIVTGITTCRLERTDPISEDAILMKILHVLTEIMKKRASILLTDHAVCTIVNTCFQVVQQSAIRGDLLQRGARHTMQELIQTIFSRFPEINKDRDKSLNDFQDGDINNEMESGYGVRSAVDIFSFLCSLLNVVEVVDMDGSQVQTADEDVQLFALVLINSAIQLSGDEIGKQPKLLRMIEDDLFHHLIHYGMCSSPLVLSMICSTVLNIYNFLRRFIRLQLEAFFTFVSFRVAVQASSSLQLKEVALEAVINFCRQPTFIFEAYANYDCHIIFRDVFEEIGRLLCKHAFPTGSPLSTLQIQAFEGLVIMIHNISDHVDGEHDSSSSGPYPVEITEKAQKRKIKIAGDHFNRDEKKGLDYLKISHLVPDPPDPKPFAYFFRYTPGLDKSMIGDYLGSPDELNLQVLKEFTETFNFSGMILDNALRTYLETFRLPGESQKIQRILEAFSERFYDQQSSEIFFTTLLNPYASAEETLYAFSNDLKARMATLAVFTIANNFGHSIKGGWRNIVDCLLKLRRLKLLPQSVVEPEIASTSSSDLQMHTRSDSGVIFPSYESSFDSNCQTSSMMSRFSHFLSMETADDSLTLGGSEFERNLKIIQQCRIGNIFSNSSKLPDDALPNLGRSLIFAAAGKGQKFSTPIEEEETVGFCWDLLISIALANVHRFSTFWPYFHDYLLAVAQFPLFSPVPFVEKAMLGLFKICLKVLSSYQSDKLLEELIFKSNYPFCIDCAFGFIALKNSPLEKNLKLLDLLADSVNLLIQWSKNGYSDPGNNLSIASSTSSSSFEDNSKFNPSNFSMNLFIKLGEALRRTSLARREEIRNHAIVALQRSFTLADELDFTSVSCINCFNLVIFAMVDDLHEKMVEYSRRDNLEREVRSMEGTLKIAMELLTDVFLQFLKPLTENSGFRTFWLGVLRRMDTCMKADLGGYGETTLQELIPDLLRKMITIMKEKQILVQKEGEDLWEITYIQIQWIAPSLKDELFPDEDL